MVAMEVSDGCNLECQRCSTHATLSILNGSYTHFLGLASEVSIHKLIRQFVRTEDRNMSGSTFLGKALTKATHSIQQDLKRLL